MVTALGTSVIHQVVLEPLQVTYWTIQTVMMLMRKRTQQSPGIRMLMVMGLEIQIVQQSVLEMRLRMS